MHGGFYSVTRKKKLKIQSESVNFQDPAIASHHSARSVEKTQNRPADTPSGGVKAQGQASKPRLGRDVNLMKFNMFIHKDFQGDMLSVNQTYLERHNPKNFTCKTLKLGIRANLLYLWGKHLCLLHLRPLTTNLSFVPK